MTWKDKAVALTFGIFRPGKFLDPKCFSWGMALVAVLVGSSLSWLEPMPEGLNMDFSQGYLALTVASAWLGWIGAGPVAWLLLRLFGARPRLGDLVRLACGASLVLVWTFPLAFRWELTTIVVFGIELPWIVWVSPSAGWSGILTVLREFLFALIFGVGAIELLGSKPLRSAFPAWLGGLLLGCGIVIVAAIPLSQVEMIRLNPTLGLAIRAWLVLVLTSLWAGMFRRDVLQSIALVVASVILLPLWSVCMQTLPEWPNMFRLRMNDPSTGLVAPLRGEVPLEAFGTARWTLHGASEAGLSPERLSLGERQRVLESSPGRIVVEVRSDRSTEDAAGSPVRPSVAAASLAAGVPEGTPNERLHNLHALVRSRIKYERAYFPGDVAEILSRGSGDCKAYAQVFAEGAAALGLPSRVVRGMLARPDGFWAHAWVSVKVDGRWRDWDPTSPIPLPDARYLRFAPPKQASSVFEGEMAIFTLDSLRIEPGR